MATTTTSVLDNLLPQFWVKRLIERLEPQTPLIQFAQKDEMSQRSGTTVYWNGWRSLDSASSSLTEGTANALVALSSRRVTATIAGYGRGVEVTDLASMTAIFDAVNGSMDVLSDSASKTVERVCQMGIFKNSITKNASKTAVISSYASSPASAWCSITGTKNGDIQFQFPAVYPFSTTRLSAVSGSAPSLSAQLSVFAVRKAVTRLASKDARPFADGYFVGYAHPSALHSLKKDPAWLSWNAYQNSKETMYVNEEGNVFGVRFVRSTLCPRYAVTARSVCLTFIFGRGAFGFTSLDGNVKMMVANGVEKSDPFNQKTTITYKLYAAAAALNPSAGVIMPTYEKL